MTEHATNTPTTEYLITREMIAKKLGKKTTRGPIIDTAETLLAEGIITVEQLASRLDGRQAETFVRRVGKSRGTHRSHFSAEEKDRHATQVAKHIIAEQDRPTSAETQFANAMKADFDFPITPELIASVTVDPMVNAEAIQYAVTTYYKRLMHKSAERKDGQMGQHAEYSARKMGKRWAAQIASGKLSAAAVRKLARGELWTFIEPEAAGPAVTAGGGE